MLAKAKDDMEQYFSFVGLTNYFDESLLLLRRILRWRKPPFYIKAKVSPPKFERGKVDLKLIQAYNELGSTLYDYAEARFSEVLAEARPRLDRELPRFRKMNQYYGLVRPLSKRLMGKGGPFEPAVQMILPILFSFTDWRWCSCDDCSSSRIGRQP